jgi:hypothetical protein
MVAIRRALSASMRTLTFLHDCKTKQTDDDMTLHLPVIREQALFSDNQHCAQHHSRCAKRQRSRHLCTITHFLKHLPSSLGPAPAFLLLLRLMTPGSNQNSAQGLRQWQRIKAEGLVKFHQWCRRRNSACTQIRWASKSGRQPNMAMVKLRAPGGRR